MRDRPWLFNVFSGFPPYMSHIHIQDLGICGNSGIPGIFGMPKIAEIAGCNSTIFRKVAGMAEIAENSQILDNTHMTGSHISECTKLPFAPLHIDRRCHDSQRVDQLTNMV